jgi:hypothetical protein
MQRAGARVELPVPCAEPFLLELAGHCRDAAVHGRRWDVRTSRRARFALPAWSGVPVVVKAPWS